MFTQFRAQYPTGGLISELLQVHEGHYLVRTLVQVGGISLASGMASAATLELAEDRARIRALALLNIHPMASETTVRSPLSSPPEVEKTVSENGANGSASQAVETPPIETEHSVAVEMPKPNIAETRHEPVTVEMPQPSIRETRYEPVTETIPDWGIGQESESAENAMNAHQTPLSSMEIDAETLSPEENSSSEIPSWISDDVQSFDEPDLPESPSGYGTPQFTEPDPNAEDGLDFTEISIQINLELKRIGWTQKQENSYLKRIYGKNGRALLSDRELLEFLHYLQAYAQTTVELDRLGWTNEQGSEYLEQTYGKKSRALLNCDELKGFLTYLQTQPTPNQALF